MLRDASLEWSGVEVGQPDLGDDSHSIALTIRADAGALHLIFNAYWEPLEFELPAPDVAAGPWRRIVDTSLDAPDDIAADIDAATEVSGATYRAEPRSVVLLAARRADGTAPRRKP